MCKRMINHGIAIIGIAILIFLSVGSASAPPYDGPDAEVAYRDVEVNLEKPSIYGDPAYFSAGQGFKLINAHLDQNIFGDITIRVGGRGERIEFDSKTINERFPLFDIRSKNVPYQTAVYISVHPKDPAKPKANLYFRLDQIEGLMSLEEAQAIVAQEENARAERTAQEEARQLAREAANRYDPSKFTVVPSNNFRPADYTSIDLFKAASASRDLQIVSNKEEALYGQLQSDLMFGLGGSYALEYKSDLTFVRQNGTDITFSSDDNAITQRMTIDQRSGLQAGQKVRVYYMITRSPLTTWDVVAIERR